MVSYEQTHRLCKQCGGSTMHYRRGTNHVLHFLITVLSCGWWALAWLCLSLKIGGWRCKECGAGGGGQAVLVGALAVMSAFIVVPVLIGIVAPSPAPPPNPLPRPVTADLVGKPAESPGMVVEPMTESEPVESAKPAEGPELPAAVAGEGAVAPDAPAKTGTPAAHPEPEIVPPAITRWSPDSRTWTDASGQFKIKADFVSYAAGQVKLKKADGSVIEIPMERLSEEDQKWIRKRGR